MPPVRVPPGPVPIEGLASVRLDSTFKDRTARFGIQEVMEREAHMSSTNRNDSTNERSTLFRLAMIGAAIGLMLAAAI